MPRDPKVQAIKRLAVAHANYESAEKAARMLTEKRRVAIIAAVNAGNSKSSVARVAKVSAARVSAICGPVKT